MWPAPQPEPCPVDRAWIGPCGQTDRTKCQHFQYDRNWPLCICGRPALAECESAGSFVCGRPICHTGYCGGHGGICTPQKKEVNRWPNPAYKDPAHRR